MPATTFDATTWSRSGIVARPNDPDAAIIGESIRSRVSVRCA